MEGKNIAVAFFGTKAGWERTNHGTIQRVPI